MKPRFAILSMLATGILLMGAGTGLAISGISSSDNASVAQYPVATAPGSGVAGQQQGGKGGGVGSLDDQGGAAGEARQLAVTGDDGSLPVTGFAAIPVIFAGLGLLVAGLVIRRRTASTDA